MLRSWNDPGRLKRDVNLSSVFVSFECASRLPFTSSVEILAGFDGQLDDSDDVEVLFRLS